MIAVILHTSIAPVWPNLATIGLSGGGGGCVYLKKKYCARVGGGGACACVCPQPYITP